MRKGILMMAVLFVLIMAGCGQQLPMETAEETETHATTAPTTVPETEPIPDTEEAVILVDQVPAILMFKNRGDRLDVVGEYDEKHYVVKTDSAYGLVQKNLIRLDGVAPYEAWNGYAKWNACLYDNFYLSGEPKKLTQNTKIEVLEDLGTCFYVKTGEDFGYLDQKQASKWPASSGGGGSDSGGNGDSGGGGSQDGGDIVMQITGGIVPLSIIDQSGEVTGLAEVLADRTPVILGYFERGDLVPVVQGEGFAPEEAGYALLYWDGIYAYTQLPLLRLPGTEAYSAWDGFAARNGKCYYNYHLSGDTLPNVWTNVAVHVLEDLGDVYLVEINDTIGYMAKDQVSETRIPVSNGGGGDSGGGGGGQEWSDPIL